MPDNPQFWPRIRVQNAQALERVLAQRSLFEDPASSDVQGAVLDAPFASGDPPLVGRLIETGIPFLVDSGSLRFVNDNYRLMPTWAGLSHAPGSALSPDMADPFAFVESCVLFQAKVGASTFLAPGVPIFARWEDTLWSALNLSLHKHALDIARDAFLGRDVVALVAPRRSAMNTPDEIFGPLEELGYRTLYLQPTKLKPTREGVEKLMTYVDFALAARRRGLRLIAGRVGSFGLVLHALGIPVIDSGLGDAEAFDLAATNRRPAERGPGTKGGGGDRRVYISQLKTTLRAAEVEAVLRDPSLAARFVCDLDCCRWQGPERLADRRLEHNLRWRLSESSALGAVRTDAWRLQQVQRDIEAALANAQVVRRVLDQNSARVPTFSHLETWLLVIQRVLERESAA